MTVDEGFPPAGTLPYRESGRGSPPPAEHAGPEAPPKAPPVDRAAEAVAIRETVTRLRAAWPAVDEATVEATVRSAYDSFRRARVRAYVAILAERRARSVLGAAAGATPAGDGERI
jgi:hypothetical protein